MNSSNVALTLRADPASVEDDLPLRTMSISPCVGGKSFGDGEREDSSEVLSPSLSDDT